MKGCQQLLSLVLLLCFGTFCSASPTPEPRKNRAEEPQFVVITEDVIPDVMNTTQKVIRVNPLDLPARKDDATGSMDSSLYNIQSLLPAHRNYVNTKRMRKPKPTKAAATTNEEVDSPIVRNFPEAKIYKTRQKKKHLHFLYNQADLDGNLVSKTMRVHVAPGAYPVYYAVSKSNGRFGKFPLKGFRNQHEFMKYLLKSKLAATQQVAQGFES